MRRRKAALPSNAQVPFEESKCFLQKRTAGSSIKAAGVVNALMATKQ
jgi:hypothetical protein